jgi:hypothetical protein
MNPILEWVKWWFFGGTRWIHGIGTSIKHICVWYYPKFHTWLGENMVWWTKSGTCKVHTRIHSFFNPFVSPLTIPTFLLYSFLKVHNFFLNTSITLVYNLFSSCIILLEWLISRWIFLHFIYFFIFLIVVMFEQENYIKCS